MLCILPTELRHHKTESDIADWTLVPTGDVITEGTSQRGNDA